MNSSRLLLAFKELSLFLKNRNYRLIFLSLTGLLSLRITAQIPAQDSLSSTERFIRFANTFTEYEENIAWKSYRQSENKIDSLTTIIRDTYDDELFLEKFEQSQVYWWDSKWANVEMKYPHWQEKGYYGSVMMLCLPELLTGYNEQRIQFLMQWIDGTQEGNVCAGSLKWSR